jgi:hypothetical protein
MPCLVLKNGEIERRIQPDPDGQFRYRLDPGEVPAGLDPNCGGKVFFTSQSDETARLLGELDSKLGKGGGDWLKVFFAPVARLMGKKNCMPCEVRRVVTNAYRNLKNKRGRVWALVTMWRLWRLSMNDPAKAAVKLKEYLA